MWTTLLKTTQWMIFCLSSGMDGTHGRTTFGDDPEQELLRRQPIVKWHKDGASQEQNANVGMFQPSYLPEIQIWLVTGYFRQHVRKGKVATQLDEMTLRDSRELNYDSKLQNMSWFCYIHVNTLSQTSMVTWQSYNKTLPSLGRNHQRGYRSPCISLALKKKLLLLEQINQWLGVLGTHME